MMQKRDHLGRKKAKEALRRGGNGACTEVLELWAKKREDEEGKELKGEERYTRSYALDKKKLELDKEMHVLEKEQLDNEANNMYLKRNAEE